MYRGSDKWRSVNTEKGYSKRQNYSNCFEMLDSLIRFFCFIFFMFDIYFWKPRQHCIFKLTKHLFMFTVLLWKMMSMRRHCVMWYRQIFTSLNSAISAWKHVHFNNFARSKIKLSTKTMNCDSNTETMRYDIAPKHDKEFHNIWNCEMHDINLSYH